MMSQLYAGPATVTLPDGASVKADVDLWLDENPPLVQWGGTATAGTPGSLWKDGQRMCTVEFGDEDSGYHVGECMIIERDNDESVERVTLAGSGKFDEVDAPG